MSDPANPLAVIRDMAAIDSFRLTQHAQAEMTAESILLDDVLEAIANGQIIEDYPNHCRGDCCLLAGVDAYGRPIHVVCSTSARPLIINTVYLPVPPKWITPAQRRTSP